MSEAPGAVWFDPPRHEVIRAVSSALDEDLGQLGDITSALVDPQATAAGLLTPRQDGVLAGRRCAEETFRLVDERIRTDWLASDGDDIRAGEPIASLSGPLASILSAERTALNFLCHLSGVATATRDLVRAAEGRLLVLDTRKTIPGLRALQKAAVRAGGGRNHRIDLSEAVLLKDNHLVFLDLAEAVQRARRMWPNKRVQVECDDPATVESAVRAGADAVLLDNMSPSEVAVCVRLVRQLAGHRCFVEVSGGISLANIADYVQTGADAVSSSAITMSAASLDIGLDLDTTDEEG